MVLQVPSRPTRTLKPQLLGLVSETWRPREAWDIHSQDNSTENGGQRNDAGYQHPHSAQGRRSTCFSKCKWIDIKHECPRQTRPETTESRRPSILSFSPTEASIANLSTCPPPTSHRVCRHDLILTYLVDCFGVKSQPHKPGRKSGGKPRGDGADGVLVVISLCLENGDSADCLCPRGPAVADRRRPPSSIASAQPPPPANRRSP